MRTWSHFLARIIASRMALFLGCTASLAALAQAPQSPVPARPPMDPLLQLMITQPSIEVTSNLVVSATFDPPVVQPGNTAVYRFTVNGLNESVEWTEPQFPSQLHARFSARGHALTPSEGKLKPTTGINYHVRPEAEGVFVVPAFSIRVYGLDLQVPEARLHVATAAPAQPPQLLTLEIPETNCYVGQPLNVRVLLKAGAPNLIHTVQEVKINGDGFLVDLANARQSISGIPPNGTETAYIYETTLSPLQSGTLTVSAQGFTGGSLFGGGAIVLQGPVTVPGGAPRLKFLDSAPLTLRVQALPEEGKLPGFTGAIGVFPPGPPQLSTNRVAVGGLVKLSIAFEGSANLNRLVPPPPPRSSQWQIFPPERGGPTVLPGNSMVLPGTAIAFTYTLVPLSTSITETPAIPFSYFDPAEGRYVDATVPPVPLTVTPGSRPPDAPTLAAMTRAPDEQTKLALSGLSPTPGQGVSSLQPLQHRAWFIGIQILPLGGLIALWQWDRRRRYYEQNPDVLRRRRARRELKRARRDVHLALGRRDAEAYLQSAIRAIQVAAAPHYPAEPRALVANEVAALLGTNTPGRQVLHALFRAADARRFSDTRDADENPADWHSQVDAVLNALEARL